MRSYGEELIERGLVRGREEGLTRGLRQGRAEYILRTLAVRGIHVDEASRQRILDCTEVETLDRWFDRALQATTLSELLDDGDEPARTRRSMNLREIAEYCWRNRVRLPFHAEDAWADDTFKRAWFRRQDGNHWVTGRKCSGWYWFELDVPLSDLQHLERPDGLPGRGCDFGKTAREHVPLFGDELCHHKSRLAVVYNGQDAKVFRRIRAHFTLQNPGTGALGIRWYPLHDRQWHVSALVLKHLEGDRSLDHADRELIKKYCISKTGRIAVEQMWRTIYGWPVLCKE